MDTRILIVEDEPDLRQVMEYNLAAQGYQVTSATDGLEGLQAIRDNPPDLIVLDLLLPHLDGRDVCRAVREDVETCNIPIIMVTACTDESDIIAGLELGADDYIAKPFSPRVLISRIRVLLRQQTKPRENLSLIDVGKIRLLPGQYEVLIDNAPISLTLTEYDILLLLAKSHGFVFNRQKIVDAVRGRDIIVTDRTVDVHVASLRKKLGECRSYLQTVRGVGYKLVAP